ncbi:(2Fe-2S)-binding protein [Verrucomicrobiales bacterium]|jgi:bacterioferritin-associated ferredoxin|nr:(2Fe-2S)-binding protein [Verrucomicrobiales bacterium]MDB4662660.1 (2Fe-2S)-binding protein [Verrucomicrobiales bacterium]MDC0276379.1 (2Fe-2S)-binding protein [Verrucomicrobiales bacterium]MDC0312277.1 (2Fe-2S)-binding protein [bacterium]
MKTATNIDLPSCDACSLNKNSATVAREDMLVCHCFNVRESTVKNAVDSGATTVPAVIQSCGAGGGCSACHVRIERVLRGMPAKCGSGRFDLCGGCGCIGVLCACETEELQEKDRAVA